MKEKVFSSYEDGLSTVTLVNKFGEFTGYARLHEEDKPFESQLAGCRFAEMKAQLKVFQAQIKQERATIKTLQNFEKALKNLKDADFYSCEWRALRKHIAIHNAKLKHLLSCKESLQGKLKEHIEYRDKTVRKNAAKRGQK